MAFSGVETRTLTKPSVVTILGRLSAAAAVVAEEEVCDVALAWLSEVDEDCTIIPMRVSAFLCSILIVLDSLTTLTADSSVRHCGQVDAESFVQSRIQSEW